MTIVPPHPHVIAVAEAGPGGESTYELRSLDGTVASPGLSEAQFVDQVARLASERAPTWVFTAADATFPVLLRAGVRIRRCHDLALTEGLLLAYDGLHDQARSLAGAFARARGLTPPPEASHEDSGDQTALFSAHGSGLPGSVGVAEAAEVVLRVQQRRLGELADAERMRLLVASESACALAAAEMSHYGLPWRSGVHRALLEDVLGQRVGGGRPKRLAELAERVSAAFGGKPVNPDHPPSVVRAFARAGIDVPSSRAWVLRDVDHPAVEPLLEYKELARLHSAHGWSWLSEWVSGERFRPVFVVGGVVSGRWASRGGGALQIPRALRVCVRADPGWKLVIADAAQLEPRVLAAIAGDARLADVSASTDLYASLADDTFDGDRGRAKIAMLSAMYGGTSGEAGPLLASMRKRFPAAVGYVEHAALAGERGEVVRSRLGRTSPPPSERWRALTGRADGDSSALRAARDWGRFTRNFVVQASAADWTSVVLALVRSRLAEHAPAAQLVFFLHDEVIVHCPDEVTDLVVDQLAGCAEEATRLVFGERCPVRFPLPADVVDCYADAK